MKYMLFHVKKEIEEHAFDYLILISLGIVFLYLLQINKEHVEIVFYIFMLFTSLYILWGTFHHIKMKNLHLKNVVEYISIGFTILFLIRLLISI